MLAGSPVAKGLFQRAITESGGWMGLGMARMTTSGAAEAGAAGRGRGAGRGAPGVGRARWRPAAGSRRSNGCTPASARGSGGSATPPPLPTLAELRARSTEEIRTMGLGGGQPIIDGWIIPEDLSITFANGKQNPVDVIAGYNKDEHTSLGQQRRPARRHGVARAHLRGEADAAREKGVFLHVHARAARGAARSEPESDARSGNGLRLQQPPRAAHDSRIAARPGWRWSRRRIARSPIRCRRTG